MKEAMCGRVLSGPEFRLPQVVISSPTGRSTNLKKSQPPGQGCSWESPPKRPNHPMSGRGPRNTSSSGLALSLNQDFRYLRFGVTSQRNAVHSGSAINATSSFDRNVTHSDRVMHWWPYGSMRLSNSEHSVSVLRGSNTFSIPLNPASSRTPFRSMSNCRNMATNFARKRSCPANWKSRSTFKKSTYEIALWSCKLTAWWTVRVECSTMTSRTRTMILTASSALNMYLTIPTHSSS
mmetsp:Transcript_78743/g.139130  ORF Transcript_78743/g.139130 Transcript_78743/m.139130 type:complete len:236 (-) Transcript_78743:685-1392(-)